MEPVPLADIVPKVMTEDELRKLAVISPDVRFKFPVPADSAGGSVSRLSRNAGSGKSGS